MGLQCLVGGSTNMAVGDAACLGQVIAEHPGDIDAALQQYDRIRVPLTKRAVGRDVCRMHGADEVHRSGCPLTMGGHCDSLLKLDVYAAELDSIAAVNCGAIRRQNDSLSRRQ